MNDLKQIQNFFSKPLKENVDKKYNDFLIALRDSGVTNMYGASPYLQAKFGLDRKEAIEILANWMKSFDKSLKENTTNWPKEVPSRYGDIIFRLVKVMPDRAKYELIDAETGKTWEIGGRVYGTVNQLKASAEDTIKSQRGRQSSQFESVNEELNLSNYGKVTPPKGGASLVGKYNSIQGESKYDTVIFDYQEGSDKPYGIVQVKGHGIYGSDLLKRLGLRQTQSWTAGVDEYIHDGNLTPVYISEDDFKALLDFWSGGLDREAKAQADFYRGRGNTSGTIDESVKPQRGRQSSQFESVNEATKEEYDALLDKEYELTKVYNKDKTEANWKKLSDIREKGKKLEKELEDQGLLEAQEEDTIDTITMDVPLFIRILEYSREDAQTDMDLHDLAEKAIAATKQQGILSMDDYDMLVGELDLSEGRPALKERISKALGEINEELCEKGKRYIAARKRAGEKSSAYLSGRAVKVCKGSIEWPKQGRKKVNEIEDNVENEMFAAMKNLAIALEKANDNVKPSPKDEKVEEGIITLGATIVGAPGLMTALGKGANYLGKAFGKDKNAIGEFLKKKGHQLEEFYIESLGGWIKAAFPNKYEGQEITDESSDLYKAAQKAYAAMLTVAAVGAGYEAGAAANVVKAGVEGGMAVLKSSEVINIIRKLA